MVKLGVLLPELQRRAPTNRQPPRPTNALRRSNVG